MNRFLITYIMTVFLLSVGIFEIIGQQTIVIKEAVGRGRTENEAVIDAQYKAVCLVGQYTSGYTKQENEKIDKRVYVTSDAKVIDYKVTEMVEKNGIFQVKITARVMPNEYLRYCPQTISDKVTQVETGSIANKRRTMHNAIKTINIIVQDYFLHLYKFQKFGDMKASSATDYNSDQETIVINFRVQIDQKWYRKLQSQLCNLLDIVCLRVFSKVCVNHN